MRFNYYERRKSYFSDCHKNIENIKYHQQFIKTYFEYEKRTHQMGPTRQRYCKKFRR